MPFFEMAAEPMIRSEEFDICEMDKLTNSMNFDNNEHLNSHTSAGDKGEVMLLCTSGICTSNGADGRPLNIFCRLCDRRFHSECLGMSADIGLYLCEGCLGEIRQLLAGARLNRDAKIALEGRPSVPPDPGTGKGAINTAASSHSVLNIKIETSQDSSECSAMVDPYVDIGDVYEEPVPILVREEVDLITLDDIDENATLAAIGRKFTFTCVPNLQDDDNYLYCAECRLEHIGNCPIHGPMNRIEDSPVAPNDPLRAEHSLPLGLAIQPSSLPCAGLGVFAQLDIPSKSIFGPFEGTLIDVDSDEALDSEYCWQIVGRHSPAKCICGKDVANSNWMRFVNCPNNDNQQNLTAFQYRGHIFYRTIKNIKKGSELLVWYGPEYASLLGIDSDIQPDIDSLDDDDLSANNVMTADGLAIFPAIANSGGSPKASACVALPAELQQHSSEAPDHSDVEKSKEVDYDYIVCAHCPLGFSCATMLQKHVKDAHRSTLRTEKCEHCQRSFTSDTFLRRHLATVHGIALPPRERDSAPPVFPAATNAGGPVQCDLCQVQCSSMRYLRLHFAAKHGTSFDAEMGESTSSSFGVHNGLDDGLKSLKREHSPTYEFVQHQSQEKNSMVIRLKKRGSDASSRPFRCSICGSNHKQLSHLTEHQLHTHGISIVYGCAECKSQFDFYRELGAHHRDTSHKGMQRVLVGPNGQVPESTRTADRPLMSRVERLRPHKCIDCDINFSSIYSLRQHQLKEHGVSTTYICKVCQQEYGDFKSIRGHRNETGHRGIVRRLVGPTDVPPRLPLAGPATERRVTTKFGRHRCSTCTFTCKTKAEMRLHQLTRHGVVHSVQEALGRENVMVGPHQCHICSKSFKVTDHLKRHMITIHGIRWNLTGTKTRKVSRRAGSGGGGGCKEGDHQQQQVQTEYRPRRYECPVCFRRFQKTDHLKYHTIAIHGMSMTYMCGECQQNFSAFSDLKVHQLAEKHSGMNKHFGPAGKMSGGSSRPSAADAQISVKREKNLPTSDPQNRDSVGNVYQPYARAATTFKRRKAKRRTQPRESVASSTDGSPSLTQEESDTGVDASGDHHRPKSHVSVSDSPGRPECHECPTVITFQRNDHLKRHLLNVHKVSTSYVCGGCSQNFVAYCDLKAHQVKFHHSGMTRHLAPVVRELDGTGVHHHIPVCKPETVQSLRPQRIRHPVQKLCL